MKTRSFTVFLLLGFWFNGYTQSRMSVADALDKKLIQLIPAGLGGYQGKCLEVIIKNTSSKILSLEIPAGQIFASEDSNVQDLVVTQSQTLALAPEARQKKQLFTMCTQSGNVSPGKGETFSLGEMASPSLHKLVQRIDAGNYQNSTAQSAVWSISNQESIDEVFGEDVDMVRDLVEVVSEERNISIDQFDLRPRRHQISTIKTSFEILLAKDLQKAQLVLVDEQGSVLRRYFTDRFYEQGFHQWKVGASHTRGDSALLFLRLMDGDEFVSEKKVSVNDSITTMKDFHSQSIMNYEVKQDLKADIGIFDKDNHLYFLIKRDHLIKKGIHRSQYIAKCQLPPQQDYFFKVLSGNEVIASQEVREDVQVFARRELKGVFSVQIKEAIDQGVLFIYGEHKEDKKVLYNIKRLNPGQRQFIYTFKHHRGPEAVFFIGLSDKTGNILYKKQISGE